MIHRKYMGITAWWRNKRFHRKCLFCTYIKMLPSIPCAPDTYVCNCKDKRINPSISRPFCSCFKLNTKKCEIIDHVFYGGLSPSEARKEVENSDLN